MDRGPAVCLFLVIGLAVAYGDESGETGPSRQDLVERALAAASAARAEAVVRSLTAPGPDLVTRIDAAGDIVNRFYWHERDLDACLQVGAGILAWGRGRLAALAVDEDERRSVLQGSLQALAYKLSRFAWVGDDHRGMRVSREARALGLDAARVNLELVKAGRRPDDPAFTRAYWLLGAQLLAAGEPDRAVEMIARAEEHAELARSEEEALLASGLLAIADLLRSPGDEDAGRRLADAKAGLAAHKGGIGFVLQLERALVALRELRQGGPEPEP